MTGNTVQAPGALLSDGYLFLIVPNRFIIIPIRHSLVEEKIPCVKFRSKAGPSNGGMYNLYGWGIFLWSWMQT